MPNAKLIRIKLGALLEVDKNNSIIRRFRTAREAEKIVGWTLWDELKGKHHKCNKYFYRYENQELVKSKHLHQPDLF